MPIDLSKYPANWREISQRIRDRANNRCEYEGCGLLNGATVVRNPKDKEEYFTYDLDKDYYRHMGDDPIKLSEMPEWFYDANEITVVLTVAHLDHDTTNNDPDNLRAYCQLHHLRHDAKYHAENAKATRARKRLEKARATGQMELF